MNTITTKCHKCKRKLNSPGAIVLYPPNKDNEIIKYHICKDCRFYLNEFLNKR